MKEKLKPCPFCGSAAEPGNENYKPGRVWCSNRKCPLSSYEEFFIEEWQQRATPRPMPSRAAILELLRAYHVYRHVDPDVYDYDTDIRLETAIKKIEKQMRIKP